MYKNNSRD